MASYAVYVNVGATATTREAERMLKRTKRDFKKNKRKKERFFFIPIRGGETRIERL